MSWSDAFAGIVGTWGEVEKSKAEAKARKDTNEVYREMAERAVEQSTSYQESGTQLMQNSMKMAGLVALAVAGALIAYKAMG